LCSTSAIANGSAPGRCSRIAKARCSRLRASSKRSIAASAQPRNTIFERLLRDPQHQTMPVLGGQRMRMAEILVQLADRRPVQVVRRGYFIVSFDEAGRLDTTRFREQQWALAAPALDRVFTVPSDDDRALDAASRFIAQDGRWRPSSELAEHIDDAALGGA